MTGDRCIARKSLLMAVAAASIILSGCNENKQPKITTLQEEKMKIESPVFAENQKIPAKYTCDGANISPPLKFSDVPKNTQSLALIMDDPDAPAGTWVHWTIWNIDPATREIAEGTVPAGFIEGVTSFGKPGYGGPCPPAGFHRYFFKLWALDAKLDLAGTSTKKDLEKAIEGHILDKSHLVGLYR